MALPETPLTGVALCHMNLIGTSAVFDIFFGLLVIMNMTPIRDILSLYPEW